MREYHTRSGFDRGGRGCRGSTVPGVVLIEGGGEGMPREHRTRSGFDRGGGAEGVPYQEWF